MLITFDYDPTSVSYNYLRYLVFCACFSVGASMPDDLTYGAAATCHSSQYMSNIHSIVMYRRSIFTYSSFGSLAKNSRKITKLRWQWERDFDHWEVCRPRLTTELHCS